MKKLFLFLCLIFLVVPCYASQVLETMIASGAIVNGTTSLDGEKYLGDDSKTSFFVEYDETDGTAALSIAVTCKISYDGDNWLSASFYDYAGGSTLQTTETMSSDGWYYFWFNQDLTVPYVKVIITPTGNDGTHTAEINVYSIHKK